MTKTELKQLIKECLVEAAEDDVSVKDVKCEKCGKPVELGTSSTLCPSCHEKSLAAAEKYYDIQEGEDDVSVKDPKGSDVKLENMVNEKFKKHLGLLYKKLKLNEKNTGDEVDIKKLTDIEVDGINKNDWPDFVDAYVSAAMVDGVELTHEQLDWVNGNYPELAQEEAREKVSVADFDNGDMER